MHKSIGNLPSQKAIRIPIVEDPSLLSPMMEFRRDTVANRSPADTAAPNPP